MASADPFIASVNLVGFNFAPHGWAFCNGQIMSIQQNTALFSLLGNYYGGDGRTTFALPDFRGRIPVGLGQGPGLSNYGYGQMGGDPTVTLILNEMPSHSHTVVCNDTAGARTLKDTPVDNIPAKSSTSGKNYASTPNAQMSPNMVSVSGGNIPHNNMQPYLVLNYIIAITGTYPPRQ